jgi:hypothetical protein
MSRREWMQPDIGCAPAVHRTYEKGMKAIRVD